MTLICDIESRLLVHVFCTSSHWEEHLGKDSKGSGDMEMTRNSRVTFDLDV